MKLRRSIAILLALLLLASLPLFATAVADLGDFSGGGDYGGSSSSDDCDGIGWALYYILRLGCIIGEAAEDAGCSHGQVIIFEILFFAGAIGLLVLFGWLRSRIRSRRQAAAPAGGAQPERTMPVGQSPLSELMKSDPNFSEQDLLEKLKNLYYRYIDCRQTGDLDPIRPYLSEQLLRETSAELSSLREAHVSEHTERLAILDASLVGLVREGETDVIYAAVITRCVRYRQSNDTGKIVSGSNTSELFETIRVELTRGAGVQTSSRETGTIVRNCPFCGAPLSLNESNQCPYCDSVLPVEREEWIIRTITRR